jgi:hypothetical protein
VLAEVVRAEDHDPSMAAPHPEEMKASVCFQIGRILTFKADARATPAGILAVAALVGASVAGSVLAIRSRR